MHVRECACSVSTLETQVMVLLMYVECTCKQHKVESAVVPEIYLDLSTGSLCVSSKISNFEI